MNALITERGAGMSASRLMPAPRPLAKCINAGTFGTHDAQAAFDRKDGRCYYCGKCADGLIALNGSDSRRGVGNHSPNPRPRYDYTTWFDGQPHTLTWNVDFDAEVKSMLTMLRRAANRHSVDITVRSSGGQRGTITVQAQPQREAGAA